jgi:hypothetical protein
MAVTPDPMDVVTFQINANPPQTPLAMSKSNSSSHSTSDGLPELADIQHLKTATEVHAFIKNALKISQLAKQLDYSKHPSTPSYRDITSTTARDTKALNDSFEKTAKSFLTSTQALQLRRARNEVWAGATYLDKNTRNRCQ